MIRGKIDPGHVEGYNRGTCKNYYEGTQMYKLAVYEVEESKKYADLDVSLTRGLRDNPDLYQRAKQAQGFDFILSDHSNANSRSDSNGVHIYRSVKRPDERLAIALAKVIADTMGAPYKILTRVDSKGNDYYGILRNPVNLGVKMPLLLEHGYHTNDKQCQWLLNDANLKLLAERKMKVIADFYGLKLKNAVPEKKPEVTAKPAKPSAGLVKIIYSGADGVNVRKSPDFGNNVDQVVKMGEVFTVVAETDKFYQLKSGLFLAKNENLVEFIENKQFLVRIKTPVLNIRSGAGVKNKVTGQVKEGQVFTIVDVVDNWGKLKSGVGWISLAYTDKL